MADIAAGGDRRRLAVASGLIDAQLMAPYK